MADRASGERSRSPFGSGWSPAAKRTLSHIGLSKTRLVTTSLILLCNRVTCSVILNVFYLFVGKYVYIGRERILQDKMKTLILNL